MDLLTRPLGRGGPLVSVIGYGAVKIGRNLGLKHGPPHDLPDDDEAARLVRGVIDLGINLIDTAPAYGLSEARVGAAVAGIRDDIVISTKVGETFEYGRSSFDFSPDAIRASVDRSLRRLRTDRVDLLLIHSDGRDIEIMRTTGAVETLLEIRGVGKARLIGLSGKTVEGARAALSWADAIMVPYSLEDDSHADVIAEADRAGVGVLVKKALASGRRPGGETLRAVAGVRGVSSVVVGSLRLEHMAANVRAISGLPA